MDSRDNGYFVYNDKYPPLCIQTQTQLDAESVNQSVLHFLQESYKDGLKDPCAILPSGLSAGEAAVFYIRGMNDRRLRPDDEEKDPLNYEGVIDFIRQCLSKSLQVEVSEHQSIFDKFINPAFFQQKNFKKNLMSAIKGFLGEIGKKSKGYTSEVKHLVRQIIEYIESNQYG